MAEIRTVTILTRTCKEIERTIDEYEKRLAKARADLAHIRAIIRLFDLSELPRNLAPHAYITRLFRYGEIGKICLAALKDGTSRGSIPPLPMVSLPTPNCSGAN